MEDNFKSLEGAFKTALTELSKEGIDKAEVAKNLSTAVQAEKANISAEFDTLKNSLEAAKSSVTELTTSNETLKNSVEDLTSKNTSLQAANDAIEAEKVTLIEEKTALETEKTTLTEANKTLADANEVLSQETKQLQVKIDENKQTEVEQNEKPVFGGEAINKADELLAKMNETEEETE